MKVRENGVQKYKRRNWTLTKRILSSQINQYKLKKKKNKRRVACVTGVVGLVVLKIRVWTLVSRA